MAGEHVAEVARGNGEGHRRPATTQAFGGHHVVDDLGHHPCPVDRVDRRQAHAVPEPDVGEHGLHHVLAVVEGAVDGHVVHVGCDDGGHLPPLDVRHPTGRMEDDDIHVVPVPTGLDGRRAGVARRGADDGDPRSTSVQLVVEEAAHQLEGDVLERQRRTVEELQQVHPVGQFDHRDHVRRIEGGVGLGHHRREVVHTDGTGDVGRHDLHRRLDVVATAATAERGPCLRHVQPTVVGEAGQQRFAEVQDRGRSPGAHVAHGGPGSVSRRLPAGRSRRTAPRPAT